MTERTSNSLEPMITDSSDWNPEAAFKVAMIAIAIALLGFAFLGGYCAAGGCIQ